MVISILDFEENIPLAPYSTFGIGGPARFFVKADSLEKMSQAVVKCRTLDIPYFILGKGSNCLFHDKGFDGVVILNKIDFFENPLPGVYHVGAGFSFPLLGVRSAQKGYSGLEFASGIPASVGGAVFMNAGANGSETFQTLTSVDYIDEEGRHTILPKEKLEYGYRHTSFQDMKGAIGGATFTLKSSLTARQKQLEIISYRTKTQPYGDKSAGCVFRNPECQFAGHLIEKAGLKGLSVGGASISNLHANFIVNKGTATSHDVADLIDLIKEKVYQECQVELESEIRVVPYAPLR